MKVERLSKSAYETYGMCEWKYFLSYILYLPQDENPAALLGTMFHKCCEILSRASILRKDLNSKVWDPEYLLKITYDYYCRKHPHIFAEIDQKKVKKIQKAFFDILETEHSPICSRTLSAEQAFRIPIEEQRFYIEDVGKYLHLSGIIDRIDKLDDNTIEIIDYKSGTRTNYDSKDRKKKDVFYFRNDIQCRMYHLAAKTLYPDYDNFLITMIYVTDGGAISVPFCDEDVEETKDVVFKRWLAITNNTDPQQNRGWHCKRLCDYGKNGVCDALWKDKNKHGLDVITELYKKH